MNIYLSMQLCKRYSSELILNTYTAKLQTYTAKEDVDLTDYLGTQKVTFYILN